ncbi:MAG: hypothetical protein KAV00_11065 [Phycisphaerae bacterium]|nr:hypothetical protein [Phycisphaerae bacterium]
MRLAAITMLIFMMLTVVSCGTWFGALNSDDPHANAAVKGLTPNRGQNVTLMKCAHLDTTPKINCVL